MQSYDIFMLAVLVITTIWGLWKGLAWQLASLGSIFLSYFVAHPISVQSRRMDSHRTSLERSFGDAYSVSGDVSSRVDSFWDTQSIHQSSETKRI